MSLSVALQKDFQPRLILGLTGWFLSLCGMFRLLINFHSCLVVWVLAFAWQWNFSLILIWLFDCHRNIIGRHSFDNRFASFDRSILVEVSKPVADLYVPSSKSSVHFSFDWVLGWFFERCNSLSGEWLLLSILISPLLNLPTSRAESVIKIGLDECSLRICCL